MVPTDENLPVPKRECLVCNAPSTGRHYGCVSCASCKLFFRRAFFDAVQSTCRRTPQCDKSAAVSEMCRSCRYSKCLKMGMNPAAVQPPRDLIGRRKRKDEAFDETVDCVPLQYISVNAKFNMLELIAKLTYYDKAVRDRKLLRFQQEMEILGHHHHRRMMQPHDSRFVTETELRSYVDWSATQPFMETLAMHDRLPLLKSAAILHLLFEECYYTSQFPVDELLVFPNGTFVPRHSDYLPEAYKKAVPKEQLSQFDQLYSPAVAERIDQVVKPLRHLKLLPEELAYVKSVLSLSRLNRVNAGGGMDSEKMLAELLRWRDRMTKALFQFYASINYRGTAERFGNIVLVAGGVISSAAPAEEVYQIMRIFQTVQHDATAELLLGP